MPSGPQPSRTLYEILGVSRTASAEEIKQRYRQLARTLHPDVNPGDPNASQKFADVNTAYKTLSDTLGRSNYDAELSLQERRAQTARDRAAGFGTATYGTQPPRPGATPNTPPPQQTANTGDEAARLLSQARTALSRMHFLEARDLAHRSLRIRRGAEAYEVLGDVYRQQGRTEEAIQMYTMSLSINPRNGALMERLQRLARGASGARRPERRYNLNTDSAYPSAPSGFAEPPSAPGATYAPRPGAMASSIRSDKRPILLMFAVVFGYGLTLVLLLTLLLYGQEAPRGVGPIPIVTKWSFGLLAILIGCGVSMGATMSITGAVRRLEDELVFSRGASGFVPPMGPVLLLLSLVSFWAAALIYLLFSALQEARIVGVARAFGAVTGIVLLAGMFYDPAGRMQVFLFGGNVVFLSFVFGWFLGDMFRED